MSPSRICCHSTILSVNPLVHGFSLTEKPRSVNCGPGASNDWNQAHPDAENCAQKVVGGILKK
jgi:hypothetical protein